MILTGTYDVDYDAKHHRIVEIKASLCGEFERHIVQTARNMLLLDVTLEVVGLSVDQTWALLYTRGAMDPEFTDDASRDNYLRVLLRLKGERGRAAVEGFLAGWATHHDTPVDSFAWHRYLGGVELRVSAA